MSRDRLCRVILEDPHGETWDEQAHVHAAECAECVAYRTSVAALGDRLQALPSFGGATLPPMLRGAMLEHLAAVPVSADIVDLPTRPRETTAWWRRAATPAAIAASLVLGIIIGDRVDFRPPADTGEVPRSVGQYISDVTHDHYLIERIGRPLEVALTDEDEMSGWLSNSLAFDIELPVRDPAFDLEGGRVWHTVGRLSAMASYVVGDGSRVILFAVPALGLSLDGAPSEIVDGVRVYHGAEWDHEARVWIDGDLAMALVAPEGHMPDDWRRVFLP